jgi:signal transduction histidine kinase
MQSGTEAEINQILAGAELWVRLDRAVTRDDGTAAAALQGSPGMSADPGGPDTDGQPRGPLVMVAGWEDGHSPCSSYVAADGGADCRDCAVGLVDSVLRSRRAAIDRCPFGIRLLGFPAPAGAADSAAVLRLGTSDPSDSDLPAGESVLRAARHLRRPGGLTAWQAEQRARGAERRRTAAAALAQMIATTEEFHRLYTTADRDRASSEQAATRLDSLARETLRESDESRTRIAHALHDTAAQSMVSAHRFLEAARASLTGPRPEAAPRHLDAAQERLLTAIREVRVVLNAIVPPGLEELGLANALEIYVRDEVPDQIAVEISGELPRAEGWLEAGLFAMTVEAINNAVLHAGASRIRIGLRATRGRGIITVTDDGVGFDPAAAHRQTQESMGLIGMTRRASWLGGRVDVMSRPGAGATIRISAPLVEAEAAGETEVTTPRGREMA